MNRLRIQIFFIFFISFLSNVTSTKGSKLLSQRLSQQRPLPPRQHSAVHLDQIVEEKAKDVWHRDPINRESNNQHQEPELTDALSSYLDEIADQVAQVTETANGDSLTGELAELIRVDQLVDDSDQDAKTPCHIKAAMGLMDIHWKSGPRIVHSNRKLASEAIAKLAREETSKAHLASQALADRLVKTRRANMSSSGHKDPQKNPYKSAQQQRKGISGLMTASASAIASASVSSSAPASISAAAEIFASPGRVLPSLNAISDLVIRSKPVVTSSFMDKFNINKLVDKLILADDVIHNLSSLSESLSEMKVHGTSIYTLIQTVRLLNKSLKEINVKGAMKESKTPKEGAVRMISRLGAKALGKMVSAITSRYLNVKFSEAEMAEIASRIVYYLFVQLMNVAMANKSDEGM